MRRELTGLPTEQHSDRVVHGLKALIAAKLTAIMNGLEKLQVATVKGFTPIQPGRQVPESGTGKSGDTG